MYFTDKIIRMGDSHKICEDYAICKDDGTNFDKPVCIIADGCSSSTNTDVGARLLSWLAYKEIATTYGVKFNKETYLKIGLNIFNKAMDICDNLVINITCLDATLIIMWIEENDDCKDICNIFMYGDGAIFAIDKDNDIFSYNYDFDYNAPYYLSARYLNPDQFIEEFPNSILNLTMNKPNIYLTEKLNYDSAIMHTFNITDFKSIMISSDGINSFRDTKEKFEDSYDDEILKELSNIKNYNGEFIKRRVSRMISDFEKRNISHYDDLSIAGISIIDRG